MKRKKILKISLVLLVVIAVSAFFVFKEINRKQKDLAEISAAYNLSSIEIIAAFTADEKSANLKYLDKIVAINGIVKSNDKDEQGLYTVVLGDSTSMSSVRCCMDSSHNQEANKLIKGMNVTVKGICTGFNADELLGSDVILKNSTLKN